MLKTKMPILVFGTIFLVMIIAAVKFTPDAQEDIVESNQGEIVSQEPVNTIPHKSFSDLTNEDKVLICRALTAAIGYHPISIVRGTMGDDGIARTEYSRPSDNTKWSTACRVEADRVVWATIENGRLGRWRNHPADEVIKWVITEDEVIITQVFSDGSESVDNYPLVVSR